MDGESNARLLIQRINSKPRNTSRVVSNRLMGWLTNARVSSALRIVRLYTHRTARHTTRVPCCSLLVPSQTVLLPLPRRSITNAGPGRRTRFGGPQAGVTYDRAF